MSPKEQVAEESARKYLEGGGAPAETSSTLADLFRPKADISRPSVLLVGLTPEEGVGKRPLR